MIPDADRAAMRSRRWIGDGLRGGIVDSQGTLEWWASGGIDTPAELFSLLDPAGGAVRVGPASASTRTWRAESSGVASSGTTSSGGSYRTGSTVVDLDLAAVGGRVRITDFVPWPGPNERAPGRVVRLIQVLSGTVDIEVDVRPGERFRPAREVSPFGDGVAWGSMVVRAGLPFDVVSGSNGPPTWRATQRLDAGQTVVVSVDRLDDEAHQPLSVDTASRLLEATVAAWHSWVGPLWVEGPYQAVTERAALTLRSLSGHGGPFGAGTMSLPRRAGGERTTDDRHVSWRDAAGAARTLARVGLVEDAAAAEDWLRRMVDAAVAPWPASLRADGSPVPEEEEVPLAGWRHSQPVRIGAPGDLGDLDLYGDVVAAHSASTSGGDGGGEGPRGGKAVPGPLSAAMGGLSAAADWLSEHWAQADGGIWSMTGPPRRLNASRLQSWFALDRMTRLARAANPLDLDAVAWQQSAAVIVRSLERDGLSADGGLRLAVGDDTDAADAALLRVAWRGPWPPDHPIVVRTVERTVAHLSSGPWMLRYDPEVDDGRPGADNPDLVASLWAVRALAGLRRWEDAHERMESICAALGTDAIISAAYDPLAADQRGDLPSSGACLALIDAAVALAAGPT